MTTFLQRKINRIKEQAEIQERHTEHIDSLILHHQKTIKRLKREQRRSIENTSKLYSTIGFLAVRLSAKEVRTMFKK